MKIAVITLAVLLGGTAAARADDLRIGSSADYPPWESVDAAGAIVGFDRDIGDEICKRIAAKCTWTNQSFEGLLPGLQVGKFDLVISGLSINEERAKQIDFSAAYSDAPNNVGVLATSPIAAVKTRADLEAALSGKVVGVQTGTTHETVARAHFPKAEVRVYDRPDQIAEDLVAGRIDAGLMERSAWEPLLKDKSLVFAGPLLTSADYMEFGHGQGIGIKKGRADLKAKLDTAIAAMLKDGTIAAASKKWFGYDLSAKM